MNCKKRKRDCSDSINVYEKLTISSIPFLPCDICNRRVYHYRECTRPHVYCSYDCYAILILSFKNDFLHSTTQSCFQENPL